MAHPTVHRLHRCFSGQCRNTFVAFDYPVPTAQELERAIKYLCLVYANEQELHSSPESPHDSECHAYAQRVQESGRMLAAEALQSVQSATTARMRGGKLAIESPNPRTKENRYEPA